jgi:Domain of unknown function (DUF6265)
MKLRLLSLLAICFYSISFPATTIAQNGGIDKLSWMSGTWTQNKGDDSVQESWLGPRGKLMIGSNLTQSAKRGSSFEFLRIAENPEGLSYYASPSGKTPAEFKLKEMSEKKVIFENLTHDFPHRIIYWLEADGALKARIEGTINGKERGMEWRFEKAK